MITLTDSQIGEFCSSFFELYLKNAFELCDVNMEMASVLFMQALNEGTTSSDIAAQFLYATGAAEALDFDIWSNKIEFLDNQFGLDDKRILGVAEDPFPVLASLIAQKFSDSQVDAMGPNIVSDWFCAENFNAIRNRCYFNKPKNCTDMSNYDLVYGVHPCEGTIPLIQCASHLKKAYVIWLCDCIHSWGDAKTYEASVKYAINLAKKLVPKNHHIEISSHMIDDVEAPVISCKPKAKVLVPGKTFK